MAFPDFAQLFQRANERRLVAENPRRGTLPEQEIEALLQRSVGGQRRREGLCARRRRSG
jgi:hypothetical protein